MPDRWLPTTEDELRDAVHDGRLDEDHRTDFKERLKDGPSGNKELAKDLAAFANDGGALVIGVADTPTDGADDRLRPVSLGGLRERIDQVARSALEPPLTVRVQALESSSSDDEGYVVVEIPASSAAPHQVDGRYRGRSDSTNYILSDAEVRAILNSRAQTRDSINDALDREIARDPVPASERARGHLYVVAIPRYGRKAQMLNALQRLEDVPEKLLRQRISEGQPFGGSSNWSPDLRTHTGPVKRRASGWAMHSDGLTGGREFDNSSSFAEATLLDLEIDEDGSLHLLCGRATEPAPNDPNLPLIIRDLITGLTRRVLLTAREVSMLTGYSGVWDCGVAVDGLRNGIDSDVLNTIRGLHVATPYSEDAYREVAEIQSWELDEDVEAATEQLLGRLKRGLQTA